MNAVMARRPRETTSFSNTTTSADHQNESGSSAGLPLFLSQGTEQATAIAGVRDSAARATEQNVPPRPTSATEVAEARPAVNPREAGAPPVSNGARGGGSPMATVRDASRPSVQDTTSPMGRARDPGRDAGRADGGGINNEAAPGSAVSDAGRASLDNTPAAAAATAAAGGAAVAHEASHSNAMAGVGSAGGVAVATAAPRAEVSNAGADPALSAADRHDNQMSHSAGVLERAHLPASTSPPLVPHHDNGATPARNAEHARNGAEGAGAPGEHAAHHPASQVGASGQHAVHGESAAHAKGADEGGAGAGVAGAGRAAAAQGLAEGAAAQLHGVGALLNGVASAGVRFALNPAEGAEAVARRGISEGAASAFVSKSADRAGRIVGEGHEAAARLLARRDVAKASVAASTTQQGAAVGAHFQSLRARAVAGAASARARVNAQYASALPAMTAATRGAHSRIDAAHTKGVQGLARQQSAQMGHIDQRYAEGDRKHRAAGPTVGTEAVSQGDRRKNAWLSQRDGESSILDGPIHDNRLEARADAAGKVADAYDKGLIDESIKQANAGLAGKPRDLAAVGEAAMQALTALISLRGESITGLTNAESQALAALNKARSDALHAIGSGLAATLRQLATAEQMARRAITDAGAEQTASVERDAAASISSIAKGVSDAVGALGGSLATFRAQAEQVSPPEKESLDELLTQADSSFVAQADQSSARLGEALALCESGLAHSAGLAVAAVEALAQMGVTQGNTHGDAHHENMTSLASAASHAIAHLREGHVKSAANTETAALGGFEAVAKGIGDLFTATDTNLKQNFTASAKGLEDGLRGSVHEKLNPDIDKEADKAADAVQPRWKKIAKILLVIAVIIVVALVVGPAVIGAVGAAAGALGASAAVAGTIGTIVGGAIVGAAAGAVIQVGSNLIDGERSLGGIFKGVGKAMVIGAIGGAFGGVGAVLGKGAAGLSVFGSSLTQTAVKLGVGFVADVGGGAVGNLAVGDPVTLEGVLIGAGIGLGVGIAAGGLGRLGKFGSALEGVQKRSEAFGEGVGGRAGSKVASTFGIEVKPSASAPAGTSAPHQDTAGQQQSSQQTSAQQPGQPASSQHPSQTAPNEPTIGQPQSTTQQPTQSAQSPTHSASSEPAVGQQQSSAQSPTHEPATTQQPPAHQPPSPQAAKPPTSEPSPVQQQTGAQEPRQIPRQQQMQQQQTKIPTSPESTAGANGAPVNAKPAPATPPRPTAHAGPEGVEWSQPGSPTIEHGRLPGKPGVADPAAPKPSTAVEPTSRPSAKESMGAEARNEMGELSSPERADVRNDAEAHADDARRQLHPRPSESTTPAERLRAALEAEGISVPPGHEAHHMVASRGGGEAGAEARRYLRLAGVEPDAAANGVPLPLQGEGLVGPAAADTAHMGLHTDVYYEEVARRLRLAYRSGGPEGVRGELANIRRALLRDDFPH